MGYTSIIKKFIPRSIFRSLQPLYHYLLSFFSALFYRWPSEDLIVIGVTGTTGKTTTVYLIAKMLEKAGFKVGFTSTAIFNDGNKEWLNDKKMTMVGRTFTQKILRQMVKNGCHYAIIETTSQGVIQSRHRFINYDVLVFTGLYPEHIDSHGSFEAYKQAKGKLFKHLKKCKNKYTNNEKKIVRFASGLKKTELRKIRKTIIVNGDDKHADFFLDFWAEEKLVFTEGGNPPVANAKIVNYKKIKLAKGYSFFFDKVQVNSSLMGEFNVANEMAAACVGLSQEVKAEVIKSGLEGVKGIPGRFEEISEGQNFTVIVDYAFEPNAVSKLYETIQNFSYNRIIHVLGSAGGGRDIARRPLLGKIAGQFADIVIVTNEDPYDDDPKIIIGQVALGAEKAGKKKNIDLFEILDRKKAIYRALDLAEENDLVLITGKGCEQAICIENGNKIVWDDRKIVKDFFINEKN